MKKVSSIVILAACALAVATAAPGRAETDYLWPRFAVTAGSYWIDTDDEIRIDGELDGLGSEIDLGVDLGLPESRSIIGLGLDWAFAEKHSLGLRYVANEREASRGIVREIEIGDTVFPVGASVSAKFEETTIELKYDYWFVRHDQFGFAGSLGLVYLGLDAEATASVQIGPGGISATRSTSANTDLPVPMIGIALKGSPTRRLVLYGNARFLPSVQVGDYEGSAGSYSVGADVYLVGPLAIGASYDGRYYRADVDKGQWKGTVDLSEQGFNLYLRLAF